MAERIQLKEPGSELAMVVNVVRPETIDKNDYYLFSNGKVELLVPQSSVKAQMEHMDIQAVEQMINQPVRFARSMKMSRANKPFWDIGWGSGAEAPSQSQAAAAPSGDRIGGTATQSSAEKPKMRDAYKDLTKWVLREIVPIYAAEFGEIGPDVVAACTQTLFIQACKAGKVE